MGPDLNPNIGIRSIPFLGLAPRHYARMALRDVIAENFEKLIKHRPELMPLPALATHSGVSKGTLHRIRKAEAREQVDQLEQLAQAFGVQAWHLCMPGFDPKNPPPPTVGPGLTDGRYSLQGLDLAALFEDRCRALGLAVDHPGRAKVYETTRNAVQRADQSREMVTVLKADIADALEALADGVASAPKGADRTEAIRAAMERIISGRRAPAQEDTPVARRYARDRQRDL